MTDHQEKVARAICRENCAFFGERPCFEMRDDQDKPLPWPNPNCDEPGCWALAYAVTVAVGEQR